MLKKILTSIILSLIAIGGFFVDVAPSTEISGGVYLTVSDAHADVDCKGKDAKECQDLQVKDMYNKLVAGLNIFLDIITIVVSPAIMLAGWLMSPDWTSGDLFNLRPTIHKLWVMVSNVTYFIYAILLIFIALATIFNSDKYGYKQLLPRLALGIILVPLTWWFVQFVISMASIVTASVINIPLETVQTYMNSRPGSAGWWENKSIPQEYKFYTDPGSITKGAAPQYSDCVPTKCLSPKDVLSSGAGMYSSLLVYGNAIFKFTEVKKLSTTVDATVSIIALIHQGIIAAIMAILFGLLVLALVFMLMMRAIKLWFYAMFSPLMTLKYVMGDGIFGNKENGESFDLKEFIGLAFVPALVGLALSFGIMILALLQSSDPTNTGTSCTKAMIESPTGCELASIMGSPANRIVRKVEPGEYREDNTPINLTEVTIGGLTFKFYGSLLKGTESSAAVAASVSNQRSILSVTGGIFGTLIIDIIGLVFIWVAVMAAKNVTKVAKVAMQPFEDMGKKVGGLAMSLPKYTPIPGTGGLSIKSAEKVVNNAGYALDKSHEEKFKSSSYGRLFGGDKMVSQADEQYVKQALNDSSSSKESRFEKAGNKIQENINKDIEYSTVFKDLAEGLKQFSQREEKIYLLKKAGYSDANAIRVIDKLGTESQYDKNNKELVSALKSIGSGNGSNTGASATGGNLNFNIKSDGGKGYQWKFGDQIETPGFKTKEEILAIMKNKVNLISNVPDETIKKELKEMNANDQEITELLDSMKKHREDQAKNKKPDAPGTSSTPKA